MSFRQWIKKHKSVIILLGIFTLSVVIETSFGLYYYLNHGPVLAGNDPYYHARVVKKIITEGTYLKYDPLLGYPLYKNNPRPPFYEVLGAIASYVFYLITKNLDWSVYLGISVVTVLSAAALTVASYLLASEVFNSKKVGYLAALFTAFTPAIVERSAFGFADWDVLIMFLSIMGYWAFARAIKVVGDNRIISKSYAIGEYKNLMKILSNRRFLKYAVLSGIFLGLASITWQGYPGVLAPIAFYLTVSGIISLALRRDISAEYVASVISYLIPVIISYPVYFWVMAPQPHTWKYSVLMLVYVLVVGGVLLYFRDWPFVVSYPMIAALGIVGLFSVKTWFPSYWHAVITGLGYFVKSRLYHTIAEAQPPSISRLMGGVGVALDVVFAFTYAWLFAEYYLKRKWETVYILVISTTYLYLAIKAARFIMNLGPFVAIIGAYGIKLFYDKIIDIRTWINNVKYSRGLKKLYSAIVSKDLWALLLIVVIVFPNVHLAVDAAIPYEIKSQIDPSYKWLGAFGIDYTPTTWVDALRWLSSQDSDLPIEKRPAVISWWDYGFWNIEIGRHPTVADNFQNNYYPAAKFLTAQNETAAILVLAGLIMRAIGDDLKPILSENERINIIEDTLNVNRSTAESIYKALLKYEYYPMTLTDAVSLYRAFREATGRFIGYVIVNARMLPWDIPWTRTIDHPGIFGAPAYLAGYNVSDFYEVIYNTDHGQLNASEYSKLVSQGERVHVYSESLKYTGKFYNSMFYRCYVGIRTNALYLAPYLSRPGYGLKHFAPVYMNRDVVILKYFDGAVVSGYVFDTNGNPAKNATVAVLVNLTPQGLPQRYVVLDSTKTNESGYYELLAPAGNVTIAVIYGQQGNEKFVGNMTLSISSDQAYRILNWRIENVNLTVKPTAISGYIYYDKNLNGKYDPYTDPLVMNATIEIEGIGTYNVTNGHYNISVLPGNRRIKITAPGYELHIISRGIGEEPLNVNISMTPRKVNLTIVLWYDANNDRKREDNEIIKSGSFEISAVNIPENLAKTTSALIDNGYANVTLNPGEYQIIASFDINGTKVAIFRGLNVTLDMDSSTIYLELQRAYKLTVRALMENGTAVSTASVTVSKLGINLLAKTLVTNDTGYATIYLPSGDYVIYASYKTTDNKTYVNYIVEFISKDTELTITLKEGYRIYGKVWHDFNNNSTIDDDEGVYGALIVVETSVTRVFFTISDASGSYEIPVLPGDYKLIIYFIDYGIPKTKTISTHIGGDYSLNIQIP